MANIVINHYLRLIDLLDGNFAYTVSDITEKLGVNIATVYKAIKRLEDSGFRVRRLKNGIWQLAHSNWRRPDLKSYVPFSMEEAELVFMMVTSLPNDNPFRQSMMRKLQECYRPDLEFGVIWNPDAPRLLKVLVHSCQEQYQVRVSYLSSSGGKVGSYVLEVFHFENNLESFDAFDCQEYRVKTFKLARLQEVEVLDTEWAFEGFHMVPPMDSFRSHGDDRVHVVMSMDARARNYLNEQFPDTLGEVTQLSETEWVFDGICCSMEGVGRFCLAMTDHVKLIKGEEVRQWVEKKVKYAAEVWGKSLRGNGGKRRIGFSD